MKKTWPHLTSDAEAEAFVDEADLTEYDFSDFVPVKFELEGTKQPSTIKLSAELAEAIREAASRAGLSDETFILRVLERATQDK